MDKNKNFLVNLFNQFNENELLYMSNELTYKMVLATFPFLIYLINILTFMGIKFDILNSAYINALPDSVSIIITDFVSSVSTVAQSQSLSSIVNISLVFAVWSSSSGFYSVMRGINRTYGIKDERRYLVQRLISVLLVLIFSLTLVMMSIFIVFADAITYFITYLGFKQFDFNFLGIFKYIIPGFFMLLNVMLLYKISSFKKIKFISTLPGAIITVITWVLTSFVYNIYINNFSKYNAVYGVIGSFMIFILWINIIAFVLLIGSQINSLLEKHFVTK